MDKSQQLREEGLVNHHVGPASRRDVWDKLPSWTVEVGHIAVLSTQDEHAPWFVGVVTEVVDNGKDRFAIDGEVIVVHELGDSSSYSSTEPINLGGGGSRGLNWKPKGKNYFRYQHVKQNGERKDIFQKNESKSGTKEKVTSPHDRSSLAYWGDRESILNADTKLKKKILDLLSANPNVKWSHPSITL